MADEEKEHLDRVRYGHPIETTDDEDDDFMDIGDEFRTLYAACETSQAKLKSVAMSLQQNKQPVAAEVLRQVAGEALELVKDLVAATGGHLEIMDERVSSLEEGGGGDEPELAGSIDDAKMLVRTFMANIKLWNDLKDSTSGEQREAIENIVSMNEESRDLVVELSNPELLQMIEEEIKQLQGEQQDGSGATN